MDPNRACPQAPRCGDTYMGRISGPLLDRFDLRIDMPPVEFQDLSLPPAKEGSHDVALRVLAARKVQQDRYQNCADVRVNADIEGATLEAYATPDSEGLDVLIKAANRFGLSARGYHRVLRVARTIADLDQSETVRQPHVAEALAFRLSLNR